jgi:hypothetical protein
MSTALTQAPPGRVAAEVVGHRVVLPGHVADGERVLQEERLEAVERLRLHGRHTHQRLVVRVQVEVAALQVLLEVLDREDRRLLLQEERRVVLLVGLELARRERDRRHGPRGVGLHEAGAQATVVGVVADGGVDVEVEGAPRAREATRRGLHDGLTNGLEGRDRVGRHDAALPRRVGARQAVQRRRPRGEGRHVRPEVVHHAKEGA